jgi:hypothetical protein
MNRMKGVRPISKSNIMISYLRAVIVQLSALNLVVKSLHA